MKTELALLLVHGSPTVELGRVCQLFGLCREEAMRRAARNELPVPTFRLVKSQKAPLLVSCKDLADFIDKTRAAAASEWERSQV